MTLLKYFIKYITVIKHKHFLLSIGATPEDQLRLGTKTTGTGRKGVGRKAMDKNTGVG
jgi:hypothetical protein